MNAQKVVKKLEMNYLYIIYNP